MSYQALYRKYRPQTFEDVKGQDVIVKTLRNQVRTGRIGHAYLFCGSRGTGKTTVAKILAKAINCENLQDGDPCLLCRSCQSIGEGTSMNVIEVDAASRNGVADFRQIIEEIAYPPTQGRYKVYIIDEVHMLSPAAFNAFLKTLEEPPEYAVFILATTDPQALPDTILSRCQRFDFRRISTDTIEQRLFEVLGKEGIEAEEKAVRYIARRSEGGMRDALSITDQCASFYVGEKLTYDHVLQVTGTAPRTRYGTMLRQTLDFNASGLLRTFADLLMDGRDVRTMIGDFTWYIRDLLLFKASGGTAESLSLTEEDAEELLKAGQGVTEDHLMYLISVLSGVMADLRTASNPRITAEVGLIRLCRPEMATGDVRAVSARMDEIERKLSQESERLGEIEENIRSGKIQITAKEGAPAAGSASVRETRKEAPRLVAPALFSKIQGQWKNTLESMEDKGMGHVIANLSEPWYNSSDKETLYVAFDDYWVSAYRDNKEAARQLEDILEAKYGVRPAVRFVSRSEMEKRTDSVKVADAARIDGIDFPIEEETGQEE